MMAKLKNIIAAFGIMAALGASDAGAAMITYNLSLDDMAGDTITGTITTDGQLGVLGAGDITAWAFNYQIGNFTQSFSSTEPFSDTTVTGSALTATLNSLIFDFSIDTAFFGLSIYNNDTGSSSLGFTSNSRYGFSGFLDWSYENDSSDIFLNSQPIIQTTPQVIASVAATSVPEPATLALFATGLGILGNIRRRRA